MLKKEPLISVVMASYNTPEEYLCECVESILNQTYTNFEFIIIDDYSKIPCKEVLKAYSDKRIKIIRNKYNMGVTKSRNSALKLCKGEYIAIMDADDISISTRFERQVEYLEKYKDVFVLGTQVYLLEGDKLFKRNIYIPSAREKYQVWLFFDNSRYIPHPSAMIRHSMIKEYNISYNEEYKKSLDYGLWVQCIKYGKCEILDEYLLKYRIHSGQITSASRNQQIYYADKICIDQLKDLCDHISEQEKKIHLSLRDSELYDTIENTKLWIEKLILLNDKKGIYNVNEFKDEIYYRWFKLCYKYYIWEKNENIRREFYKSIKLKYIIRSFKFTVLNRIINRKKVVRCSLV